jgi:hypothetical protein
MVAAVAGAGAVMLAAAIAEAAVPATGGLAVEAAAIAAFAGGGERLPGVGKDPPLCAPSCALPAAWRRADFAPTLLSVAAKSWPRPVEFKEPPGAASLICAGSEAIEICETMRVAFIASETASDVPSGRQRRG